MPITITQDRHSREAIKGALASASDLAPGFKSAGGV